MDRALRVGGTESVIESKKPLTIRSSTLSQWKRCEALRRSSSPVWPASLPFAMRVFRVPLRRLLSSKAGGKVFASAEDAVSDMQSGQTLLIGGFGLTGVPEKLIEAVRAKGVNDLTVVSSNVGTSERGLGRLFETKQISKMGARARLTAHNPIWPAPLRPHTHPYAPGSPLGAQSDPTSARTIYSSSSTSAGTLTSSSCRWEPWPNGCARRALAFPHSTRRRASARCTTREACRSGTPRMARARC